MILYTIGHSNHKLDYFISILKRHNIKNIIDVRSQPYSRYNTQYNRENIKKDLNSLSINYIFMGDKLGGKPKNLLNLINTRNDTNDNITDINLIFELIKKTKDFKEGIEELIYLLKKNYPLNPISIMCAEENPLNCHRYHLISNYILKKYKEIQIIHIRGNGELNDNENLLKNSNIHPKKNQIRKRQLELFA